MMKVSPLTQFIVKVILLLPLCYWGWYSAADFLSWIAARTAEQLLTATSANLVYGFEWHEKDLLVVSKIMMPQPSYPVGHLEPMTFAVHPLNFNYGLPLCVALILASPGGLLVACRNILIAVIILLLVQIWGIYFDVLRNLFIDIPMQLGERVNLPKVQLYLIAMGFQFGSMVFPAVTPLVIWGVLYQTFIVSVAPALRKVSSETGR